MVHRIDMGFPSAVDKGHKAPRHFVDGASTAGPGVERRVTVQVLQEDRVDVAPARRLEDFAGPRDRGRWRLATPAEERCPDRLEVEEQLAARPVRPAPEGFGGDDADTRAYLDRQSRIVSHSVTQYRDGRPVVQVSTVDRDGEWHLSMNACPDVARFSDVYPYPTVPGPRPSDPHPADGVPLARLQAWDAEKNRDWQASGVPAVLKARYGDNSGMTILELGPNLSTVVQRTLAGPESGNHYVGLDHPSGMRAAREVLTHEDARWASTVSPVAGTWNSIPMTRGSVDLVTAFGGTFPRSCEDDVIRYIDEVARVLKPGGEFVTDVGGTSIAEHSPKVVAHLLDRFHPVDWDGIGHPSLVVLRKS